MAPLVTIIVPVYNMEKYVGRCIKSITEQTYGNLEIILVDDGSADKSGEICDKYAGKDRRIKVIHKTNGGVSAARNTALDAANGDYIAFVDADDVVLPNYIEDALYFAEKTGCELVIGGVVPTCDVDIKVPHIAPQRIRYTRYNGDDPEIVNAFLSDMISLSDGGYVTKGLVAKLYAKKIIEDKNFDLKMKIGEDAYFINTVLTPDICICLVDAIWYYYFNNVSSATHKYDPSVIEHSEVTLNKVSALFKGAGRSTRISVNRKPLEFLTGHVLPQYIFNSKTTLNYAEKRRILDDMKKRRPWKLIFDRNLFRASSLSRKLDIIMFKYGFYRLMWLKSKATSTIIRVGKRILRRG